MQLREKIKMKLVYPCRFNEGKGIGINCVESTNS